jgi:Transposase DDE domain.
MTFPEIIMLILKGINTATQTALDRFFSDTCREEMTMSQQAFSKARSHFDHSPFLKMFQEIVKARYCGEHEIKLMHGYQILAIDGSSIALPDMPALLEAFGGTGRNSDSPTAKASMLYDVLNDFIIDAELNKAGSSEREMALRHMEKLKEFCPGTKKLLIFDRGYPSAEMLEELETRGLKFLMRVRKKWNCAVDAAVSNTQVQLKEGITLRVIRFELPSGEEETLVTNLNELAEEEFAALYFKRWPIETKYDVCEE